MADSYVIFDKDRCVGCGACVDDCFPGALSLVDGAAVWSGHCLECGHCVAVCPEDAVSFAGYDMAQVKAYDPAAFSLNPTTLVNALKFRRSVRSYEARPLGDDVVDAMAEALRYTPTARNAQGTSLTVVRKGMDEFRSLVWEELPGVAAAMEDANPAYAATFKGLYGRHTALGEDPLLFDAPAFVALVSPNMWDAGMAAAHIEMAAVAHGAGVLHSGYLKRIIGESGRLRAWLGLGEDDEVACCMLAGYPAVRYLRTAPRKPVRITER